jgi:hypothetical protein
MLLAILQLSGLQSAILQLSDLLPVTKLLLVTCICQEVLSATAT